MSYCNPPTKDEMNRNVNRWKHNRNYDKHDMFNYPDTQTKNSTKKKGQKELTPPIGRDQHIDMDKYFSAYTQTKNEAEENRKKIERLASAERSYTKNTDTINSYMIN